MEHYLLSNKYLSKFNFETVDRSARASRRMAGKQSLKKRERDSCGCSREANKQPTWAGGIRGISAGTRG
jgi:hypothetical protein